MDMGNNSDQPMGLKFGPIVLLPDIEKRHLFTLFFGAFFGLNLAFNKNFVESNIGFPSKDAMYMGRPLGFLMSGVVLMLIATLFQIGGFQSTNEVLGALFVFTVLATLYNLATTFKILESFDGNDSRRSPLY